MAQKLDNLKKKRKNLQKQKCLLKKKVKNVSELLNDKKQKISEDGFSILQACFGELELDAISNNLKKKKK